MAKLFGRWVVTAAWALSLGACAFTDPGNGTDTLMVVIDMNYNANTTDNTAVTATVNQGDLRVGNANIVLTDSDTGQNFTIDPNAGVNLIAGYHRRMEVRVTAGANTLTCQLEGPSRHTVTAPLTAQQHSITDDLNITWQTPDGLHADQTVIVAANSAYQTTTNDDGWFTIPARYLRPGDEQTTVRRVSQVTPAGGTNGSLVRTTYEISVSFPIR